MRNIFIALLITCGISGCSDGPASPTWSDSAPTFYITSVQEDGSTDVVRWQDGMSAPVVIVSNARIYGPPAQGKIVVTRYVDGLTQVIMANADGTGQQILFTYAEGLRCATLSPDARFVACTFVADGDGALTYTTEIRPLDGSDPVRIAGATAADIPVKWSPTRNTLAFMATRSEVTAPDSLLVINADGSGRKLLSTDIIAAPNDDWKWATDGEHILNQKPSTTETVLELINVTTGDRNVVHQSREYVAMNAVASRKIVGDYYVVRGSASTMPLGYIYDLMLVGSQEGEANVVRSFGTGAFPYHLSVSRNDAYIAYGLVDLAPEDGGGPLLMRSPIKVVRRSDNTVIDLGVSGGLGYWK